LRTAGIATIAALAVLAACGPRAEQRELLVGAASDLALAMPHLAAAFEEETGVRVSATLGSSGQIAQQVLQGAPVDVFLSADRGWVERLAAAGRLERDGRVVYARGRLVLVTARRHAKRFESLTQLGADVRVAIANPQHAPYGRAARQALQAAGAWDRLEPRLVIAENVRQTLQFVGTGDVDAAISALALMPDEEGTWVVLPESLHEPLEQEAAVLADRPMTAAALQFIAFLASPRGREILEQHRFVLPDRATP
jgi:molybdate transport system substrate-binding protein